MDRGAQRQRHERQLVMPVVRQCRVRAQFWSGWLSSLEKRAWCVTVWLMSVRPWAAGEGSKGLQPQKIEPIVALFQFRGRPRGGKNRAQRTTSANSAHAQNERRARRHRNTHGASGMAPKEGVCAQRRRSERRPPLHPPRVRAIILPWFRQMGSVSKPAVSRHLCALRQGAGVRPPKPSN